MATLGFEYSISDNVKLWHGPMDLERIETMAHPFDDSYGEYGWTKVSINNIWYPIIPKRLLLRRPNTDGYFRYLYIQINFENSHYYIGKANRSNIREVRHYAGSGLRFKKEYLKHKQEFCQFVFLQCGTSKETELHEANIVTKELLEDPNCLNLVSGGAGVAYHPTNEERRQKISRTQKRLYKEHPEIYQRMLQASHSDTTNRKRAESLKTKMRTDFYRNQSSNRMKAWRENHPDAYLDSRKKLISVLNSPETRDRKRASHEKWVLANPEKWAEQQRKMKLGRETPEAKEKRKESLRRFNREHPDIAKINANKRAMAAAIARRRSVYMFDPITLKVLGDFPSARDAARWLVSKGIASNVNAASSINAVCQQKRLPGHGIRKKAFGYIWSFDASLPSDNRRQLLLPMTYPKNN